MFANMLTMKREALAVDSVLIGWLRNPVLFGTQDKEAMKNLNIRAVSLSSRQLVASNQDTQDIMKMVLTPPSPWGTTPSTT